MSSNTDIFLESILHNKHRVYGYSLKPLTLFHLALIEKFAPTALQGVSATEIDLKTACAICSCRNEKDFNKIGSVWRVIFNSFFNHTKQTLKFNAYILDYMDFPECSESKEEEKNNPFPFYLMFAGKLIKETGYKFDEVFYTMPVSKIFWLISVLTFIETGESQILSDKEKLIYSILHNDK